MAPPPAPAPDGFISGTGSPLGVLNSPIGTVYRDSTTGNLWEKSGGTSADWNRLVRYDADGNLTLLSSVIAMAGNNRFAGQLVASSILPGPSLLQGGGSADRAARRRLGDDLGANRSRPRVDDSSVTQAEHRAW